jgi:hypothetical protein
MSSLHERSYGHIIDFWDGFTFVYCWFLRIALPHLVVSVLCKNPGGPGRANGAGGASISDILHRRTSPIATNSAFLRASIIAMAPVRIIVDSILILDPLPVILPLKPHPRFDVLRLISSLISKTS